MFRSHIGWKQVIDLIVENFNEIAGGILAACFTAFLVWRHYLKSRKIQASDRFKTVLLNELKELYPEGIYSASSAEVKRILKGSHSKICNAVVEYSDHVKDKNGFQVAWDDFSGINMHRDIEEEPRYAHYTISSVIGNDFHSDPRRQFVKDVEKLLSHAAKT